MDSDDDLIVLHTNVYIAQSFCDGKSKGQPGSATTGSQPSDIAVSYLADAELDDRYLISVQPRF